MDWLQVVVIVAILVPLYYFRRAESRRLADPRYIVQASGAAVGREALTIREDAELIGYYDGTEIRGSVEYLGRAYRFERVAPPSYKEKLRPGELYVEPGLLYVAA